MPNELLEAYEPTFRERAANALNQYWYGDDRAGQDKANRLLDVLDMTGMVSMGNALWEGPRGNPLNMAMSFVPGPAKKAIRAVRPTKKAAQPKPTLDDQIAKATAAGMSLSKMRENLAHYVGMARDRTQSSPTMWGEDYINRWQQSLSEAERLLAEFDHRFGPPSE